MKQAERILRDNRIYVLAIAHALEAHKTLSGEDVEAIMNGTVGPLVDGRIYADPAYQEELERYHTEVAGVRRGETARVVALPPVPDREPEASEAASVWSRNGSTPAPPEQHTQP